MPYLKIRTRFGVQGLARVKDCKTFCEELRSLPNWRQYLKEGVDAELLE
jgi:hypothetical protein